MGRVTATITVTNEVDNILAEREFIPAEPIRSITVDNVLVDKKVTPLCLPADIIAQLGLTLVGEIDGHTAIGSRKFRLFKDVTGASHICKNTSSGSFLLPSSSFLLAPDSWLLPPIFSLAAKVRCSRCHSCRSWTRRQVGLCRNSRRRRTFTRLNSPRRFGFRTRFKKSAVDCFASRRKPKLYSGVKFLSFLP